MNVRFLEHISTRYLSLFLSLCCFMVLSCNKAVRSIPASSEDRNTPQVAAVPVMPEFDNSLNQEDKKAFIAQQKEICAVIDGKILHLIREDTAIYEMLDEAFRKIANIFQIKTDKEEKEEFFTESVFIEKIAGYTWQPVRLTLKHNIQETNKATIFNNYDNNCITGVAVLEQGQDHQSIIPNARPAICIDFQIGENAEKIKLNQLKRFVYIINSSTRHPIERLQYYRYNKTDHVPGDVCCVQVVPSNYSFPLGIPLFCLPRLQNEEGLRNFDMQLTDRKMFFIRGNVAVYLESYYKHIGCWDLACKIDAALVEQMKKKEREKLPEQKTGNDEKNNGKTE